MRKVRFPAALLSLFLLISMAPLTVSAPANVSASNISNNTNNTIKVQSMNVKLTFDGVIMEPPVGQYVFIYNNTTYVPLRFVSYALQKSVSWDAKNLKVTVAEPSSAELVVIKEYLMNATNNNSTSTATKNIILNSVKASYGFNGAAKSVPAGQSSYLLNGSLYIPLRFLSESVGNEISWNQKSMTITAESASYKAQTAVGGKDNTTNNSNGKDSGGATATPAPTTGATGGGSAGAGAGAGGGTAKVSYESITSETEAKLNALESESRSTLMATAIEYLSAKDADSKASIKARGVQQLASFTSSFNSILSDCEAKLQAGGYDTGIISQYRAAFEASLQQGKAQVTE